MDDIQKELKDVQKKIDDIEKKQEITVLVTDSNIMEHNIGTVVALISILNPI